MSELNALVQSLSAALMTGDEASFQALCSPAGWESRGDSAQRLWRQGSKSELALVAANEGNIAEDRASIAVGMLQAKRGSVGKTSLLFVRGDDGWRLEGVNSSTRFAQLFMAGKVPALLSHKDLAGDAAADAWATAALGDPSVALAGLEGADRHIQRASAPGITLTFVESRVLEAVDRAMVLYELAQDGWEYPDKMVVLLERNNEGGEGGWRPIKLSGSDGVELLIS